MGKVKRRRRVELMGMGGRGPGEEGTEHRGSGSKKVDKVLIQC
jgi:hypothetical protein